MSRTRKRINETKQIRHISLFGRQLYIANFFRVLLRISTVSTKKRLLQDVLRVQTKSK